MSVPAPLGPVVRTLELERAPVVVTEPVPELFQWTEGTTDTTRFQPAPFLQNLREARTVREALTVLFGGAIPDLAQAEHVVAQLLAAIDGLLTDQINAIIHHPQFQALEASWRGLEYLVFKQEEAPPDSSRVVVKILTVKWEEVSRDFERASDFDQSLLFSKVYDEAFGMPGGHPFGVLVGDFQIRPTTGEPSDIDVLRHISQVAAASFCPFLTAASPQMMGLDRFSDLEATVEFDRLYSQPQFLKWNKLRDSPDSRFLVLTLPRALMRLPYDQGNERVDGFDFREDTSAPDRSGYLWGNPAYALAGVVIRSYQQTNWMTDISGVQRGVDGGGLVTGLPAPNVETDRQGTLPKFATDLLIDDRFERELTDFGFLPLCHLPGTPWGAFLSSTSIQRPAQYDRAEATLNARLTSLLRYILCVSRFAHYLKVLARDRIGQVSDPKQLERYLNTWISNYVTASDDVDSSTQARYPLREAEVRVTERPGQPGAYDCTFFLRPHAELETISAGLRLETKLTGPGGRQQ